MKISVQNLGAIKEGTVSLDKKLTVLVGANDSGKSYMAYLIYGIMTEINMLPKKIDILDNEITEDENGYHIINVKDILLNRANAIEKHFSEYTQSKIKDYFASNKVNPIISITDSFFEQKIKNYSEESILNNPAIEALLDFSDNISLIEGNLFKYKGSDPINFFKPWLAIILKSIILESKDKTVYFFPTERLALSMLSNNEVERKSKLQDKLSKLFLDSDESILEKLLQDRNELKPNYPQAINDYIYFINDLRNTVKQKGDFEAFADEIQQMLMEGKVSVSSFGDINYTPKDTQEAIEVHISSSLVKSLSGLILYFRHLAKEGDTIIIDEPEVNLHPNNQRIIARVIAKAVNKGFRVILSTHSDYFIKELNNLIMLNKANENAKLKEELLKDLTSNGYDADCYLDKKDLGVYFFNNNTIQELEVDDMGFDVSTIDIELGNLNYASEHIYYSLFNQEA